MEEVRILKNTIYTVVVCIMNHINHIRRLPTQATIRPQPTPIPPQNTMATIAKQINAAATGHSLRMEFVYRRTRVSWTHAARNARNGDGHAKHLAQQTERTATFKNNRISEVYYSLVFYEVVSTHNRRKKVSPLLLLFFYRPPF